MGDTLGVSAFGFQPGTTTAFTAATPSATIALQGYKNIRISVTAQGLWIKFGTSGVTATAGTSSEIFVPPNWSFDIVVPTAAMFGGAVATVTHVAYIQDAASSKGSITLY